MTAHPDGNGFWVLYRSGHVESYGSASLENDGNGHTNAVNYINSKGGVGTDPWGAQGYQAFDIAATYDGTNVRFYIDGVLDSNQPTAIINFPSNR